MATTVPEAVQRDTHQATIDQHQPAGNWILPTSASPNLQAPAMPPTFGLPEPKPDDATVDAATVPWAPLQSESNTVVSDIKVLSTELAATEKNLRSALAATLREHAQLLELLVAQDRSPPVLERSESALAQVVLLAEQRLKGQAESRYGRTAICNGGPPIFRLGKHRRRSLSRN